MSRHPASGCGEPRFLWRRKSVASPSLWPRLVPGPMPMQLPLTSRPSMLAFMNASAQQLLKDAMALPETERADLAYELLASLPTPEPRSPRSDREWIAEIERRAHRAVAGDTGVSWSEARSQIEDRLRGR